MGKIVKANQPCLDQTKCKSSDARQIYEEGTSFCFSCGKFFKKNHDPNAAEVEIKPRKPTADPKEKLEEVSKYGSRGFQERDITRLVCEFFNVKVSTNEDGSIAAHYYPYNGGAGYKCRKLPKQFTWIGEPAPDDLFGKELFAGGGKRVIITEGELDALSFAQATYDKYNKFYPVVSVANAGAAEKALLKHREWLRSFKEIILCLDNDEAGKKAEQQAIRILGIDKVKIWNPGIYKDASDILVACGTEQLYRTVWDAEKWSPAGIIKKSDIWKQIVERNNVVSTPYPPCLNGVNKKLKGMRDGEIALFISGTGSGKSTIIREICLHVLETTGEKVGVISLEESPGETGMKLAGMAIYRNPANEEISDEDLKVGFDKVFGPDEDDERVIVLDHQGAIKDASIIDQLEYMCLMGCKKLFIDHITILVSEGAEDLTGNEAIDKIMNDLLRLVKRHNVWVGLVSHLRKVASGKKSFEEGKLPTMDDIRGSGSIKQVSFDIIAFARDMSNENEMIRNMILMSVLKGRTIGLTGPVNGATYCHETGRLTETADDAFEFE